jgi:uncharacterized membrane protein (DUF4010 family)
VPLDPLFLKFALLLGLALFFGLAFEDYHARAGLQRPGGIRTFPLLALSGGVLFLLDPDRKLPLVAGLLILGAWLYASYRRQLRERTPDHQYNVELVPPACNMLAYLIGPAALALPAWIAIAVTVAAVLLMTTREALHALAQKVELREIVTTAEFLILTGIVLPLLPDRPVTSLTAITPYKAWLALLAVCTLSYGSYLLQRFWASPASDLAVAFLGGLYSSTATTVIFARAAKANPSSAARAQAGIILATSVMYLRILAVIAVFDLALAKSLAPILVVFCLAGLAMAAWRYRGSAANASASPAEGMKPRNPLELTAAAVFALIFVVVSIAAQWAQSRFGAVGVDSLAVVVGFTDIDPFVLSIAQGGTGNIPVAAATIAILIAISSNNILKAVYTAIFAGWRASWPAIGALAALAIAGIVAVPFI